MSLRLRMMLALAICILAPLSIAAAAQTVTYATGSWPEDGFGNHRAVVHVNAAADAVWAHIEWRRRDRDAASKDIRVYDLATGKRVLNVVRASINRFVGDIVFQPATAPGDYAIYFMPYKAPKSNFDQPGTYFPPSHTASADWRARNGLTADGLKSGAWRNLPRAPLLRIEARTDFDRVDPMEIVAMPDEVAALLKRHPDAQYLVFPEDRKFPIRMLEELPLRWMSGPSDSFSGEAQPGEYYCLQLGVWAARTMLGKLAVDFTNLRNGAGATISRDKITCFNLGGTNWLGRAFRKTVIVPQGHVQPLWIGLQVPRDAKGTYTGTFTVAPDGARPTPVKISLRIVGPILDDGGVSDLWRMSRLKWLNSKLGIDDDVVPPYTPLRIRGDTISCLLRDVRFGALGLPASIVSSKREILAAPMSFSVMTAKGALAFSDGRTVLPKVTTGVVDRLTVSHNRDADLTVRCRMEADGCLMYTVTVDPHRVIHASDVRLDIAQRKDCSVYMMGLGKRGGYRPPAWHWKWDHKRANNMVWVGDVGAGMQLQLRGEQDVWEPVDLTPAGFGWQWDNGGKGGCDVTGDHGHVLIRAYTGARTLEPGKPLKLRFRLLITPFKPIDPNHWNWRYGDTNADATIYHLHHGTVENPFINYPFLTVPAIKALVAEVKAKKTRRVDFGGLTYPAAGNFNPTHGSLHVWVTVDFDPAAGSQGQSRFNQSLFHLDWPGGNGLGFYWNIDDRGMRVYLHRAPVGSQDYPILLPSHSPKWKRGQRHLISLSWGDEIAIYVDGVKKVGAPYKGTWTTPLAGARLQFDGSGFIYHAIKISDEPYSGGPVSPTLDAHTLLLDNFANWKRGKATQPERGKPGSLTGTVVAMGHGDARGLRLAYREEPALPRGLNLYYNVGQLSNHAVELWVIRSLGDEIMVTHSTNPTKVGDTTFGAEGGGYPWLREHLVRGYVPAWRQPLPWLHQSDAALQMQPLSRWHNYYVEGLNWLMRNAGVDGLYLDGISYDREIMKRVAKVMYRNNPHSRITCHGADVWSSPWDPDRRVSTANAYMEHFPYLSSLWFGEQFNYDMPPDYWLVEISGIPFGLTSEMLNYQNGGNAYRGMLYGMTGRQNASCHAMWQLWDDFGIQTAQWLGYWDKRCPVKTDMPGVLATVYRKKGKSLIALADWPAHQERQHATAHETSTPPTIDGTLAPGEWASAARLTNFTLHESKDLAPEQTEVYVTSDRTRLYMAFRCAQPGGHPKTDIRTRDGNVWEDDAVEIFLQPNPKVPKYFQFIGNSAGTIYDGTAAGNSSWNGDWTYKTSVGADYWAGELSIPLASIGIKSGAGDVTIGLNICRDGQRPAVRASCWAPVSGSFHNTDAFGRLTLSPTAPSTRQKPESKSGPKPLMVYLKVNWKALGLNPAKVKLTAPAITAFQSAAEYKVGEAIPIEPSKGAILIAHE